LKTQKINSNYLSEDPESFKIGTGNRKVLDYDENKSKANPLILYNKNYNDEKFEAKTMVSNVSNNPIPYGEESIAERINKINALNKKGNYIDPKYLEKKKVQSQTKNVSYSPKNIDKAKDRDEYLQGMIDNYNLLEEKEVKLFINSKIEIRSEISRNRKT